MPKIVTTVADLLGGTIVLLLATVALSFLYPLFSGTLWLAMLIINYGVNGELLSPENLMYYDGIIPLMGITMFSSIILISLKRKVELFIKDFYNSVITHNG